MNKTTVWSIIISLTLILGLAGAIALVRTSQDYRSSAAFGTGSITLLPSPVGSVSVGSETKIHVSVNGGDKTVNGLQTLICYGPELEVDTSTITAGTNFELFLSKITQSGTRNCVDLAVGGKTNATLSSGVVEAATITFKAVSEGSGTIEIMRDKTIVSGENPGQTDNQISMGSVTNSTYTVGASTNGVLSGGSISVVASRSSTMNIGEEQDVSILVNGGDKKVNGLQTAVCYDSQFELVDINKVLPLTDFEMILSEETEINGKRCVKLAVGAKTSASLSAGSHTVVTILLRAVQTGTGLVEILKDQTIVSVENVGSVANEISMDSVKNVSITVVDSTTKLINFKVSFQGVTPASQCANNMEASVVVLSAGSSHAYTGVNLNRTSETNSRGLSVYTGSVALTDVQLPANDVAIFVKGPKHLQMKYGADGQTAFYNKSGGELNVSSDVNDGKVYNFQNYPMMAGDVTGSNSSVQDGIVDGLDFNFVKSSAISRDTVSNGETLETDLDGSCQANSADVTTLMLSLKEKQAQLY